MDWKKVIATTAVLAVTTSGAIGFSYSLTGKKFCPFIKVSRTELGLSGATETILAYDFANKIISGSIERKENDIKVKNPLFQIAESGDE